jgi:hypothetical protein
MPKAGELDSTFGQIATPGYTTSAVYPLDQASVWALLATPEPEGDLIVAGYAYQDSSELPKFSMQFLEARYSSEGLPIKGFGDKGVSIGPTPGLAAAVMLQGTNLVAAGRLERYSFSPLGTGF